MSQTISVVIPTYRRNSFLRRALESVHSQTYPTSKIEPIVVDGADGNAESLAAAFEATYLSPTPDPGIAGCRQLGVETASGDYIHFLDDDDTLAESALERQLEAAKTTGAGVVYGAVQWPDGRVVEPNPDVQGEILEHALTFDMAPCIPSTMLVEAEALAAIPSMDSLPSDDIAVNIELAQRTEYAFVTDVVARRQPGEPGVGGDSRIVDNRWQTIAAYQRLYDQYPDAAGRAKAATNLLAAQAEFRDHRWSPQAIGHGLRAAWNAPSVATVGYALATLCGRPSRDLARQIYTTLLVDETHSGKLW